MSHAPWLAPSVHIKVWLAIPVLYGPPAGYFSRAILLEIRASNSSASLCVAPAISSKSCIATNYALNMQFPSFCQPGVVSHTCAMVLTS